MELKFKKQETLVSFFPIKIYCVYDPFLSSLWIAPIEGVGTFLDRYRLAMCIPDNNYALDTRSLNSFS